MADGFDRKQRSEMGSNFVVYQDDEFGLGYEVASDIGRPSRRLNTSDTLSTLITRKADKAIIPLENDLGGYDTSALASLLDFKDLKVVGERSSEDDYCLAAPSFSIHEIAQAAFPGSNPAKAATGSLMKDNATQKFFRNRVETVFASPDAFKRCKATIDELRADGIEVKRLPEDASTYREVLKLAREDLDPNRKVRTQVTDHNYTHISDTTAANFSKPLVAALIPQNIAAGVGSKYNETTGLPYGSEFGADYVVLSDALADGNKISTRFLVVERKADKKPSGTKTPKPALPKDQIINQIDKVTSRYARILLKLDTRGEKTGNISDITDQLVNAGINFRPIYLHDRPDVLPVILEIEVDRQLGFTKPVQKALSSAWDKAFNKTRNHSPVLLAAYGTDETVFDGILMPVIKKKKILPIIAIMLAVTGSLALAFWLLQSTF